MANIGARAAGISAEGDRDRGRTAAQWYSYIVGAVLLAVGLFGFISDSHFDTGTGQHLQGDGFLGFEVNGWHNLVHIASGLFLLAFAAKRRTAKAATLAFGAIYGVVTVIGLIDGNDILGLFPINAADNVLHAALSLTSLAVGFMSPADDRAAEHDRRLASPRERAHEPVHS